MILLYLESDECIVLLRALAHHVAPTAKLSDDATALSAVVWNASQADPVQRSLATALAEATYA